MGWGASWRVDRISEVTVVTNRDVLREAKERLHAGGLLLPSPPLEGLPEPIERSWRRSVAQGLSPDITGLADPADLEPDERLLAAARPVLTKLAEDVAEMRVGVVLSDAQGRIIHRIALNREHSALLDRAGAVNGSDFAEGAVGTNGLGSVIEERAPLFVRGAEHFIDALEEISCAGVPIFELGTHRVRGSLSLTCRAAEANPLMLTLAHTAVRDIEQRLTNGRTRGLLDIAVAFADATRRHRGAVALLTPSTVLANTAGLSYVSPANHAAIWDRLVEERVGQTALVRMELVEGRVDVRARRVHLADEQLAFQVAFTPVRPGAHRARTGPRWHPLRSVHNELCSVANRSAVVAIVGEQGTGRATSARRLLQDAGADYRDIDAGEQRDRRAPSWDRVARNALTSGSRVLLRSLEGLPDSELPKVQCLMDLAAEPIGNPVGSARLVLTLEQERASEHLFALIERGASVVELPNLAAMRSAIPLIVQSIVTERSRNERCIISAAAMQALSNREWPGNISELRRVVLDLLARYPGALVHQADLPQSATGRPPGGRVLTPIERSERVTIVQALREAQGNRAAAARILGIGRTTLYRKLRSLRIDDEELAS